MTLVTGRAVLTDKGDQFSMQPGVGIHEGLVWCRNPKLSRLPAHPMDRDPLCCKGSRTCVGQPGAAVLSTAWIRGATGARTWSWD
jgi:hypothetical protein